MLQYVALPCGVVQVSGANLDEQPCQRFKEIFDWLRAKNVEKIDKVIVEDDHGHAHSDEDIEKSLEGFDVRLWDWKKPDICIQTILNAAPNVSKVWLYSNGNNAVLRGWSDVGGLNILPNVSPTLSDDVAKN